MKTLQRAAKRRAACGVSERPKGAFLSGVLGVGAAIIDLFFAMIVEPQIMIKGMTEKVFAKCVGVKLTKLYGSDWTD